MSLDSLEFCDEELVTDGSCFEVTDGSPPDSDGSKRLSLLDSDGTDFDATDFDASGFDVSDSAG